MAAPLQRRCSNPALLSPARATCVAAITMPIIAVVNRKGGSGKSTIATHLAAYLSTAERPALLGDVDRQQSTQGWLRRRAARKRPRVVGWSIDPKTMVRPPAGAGPVVLDTPGGLRGLDLARVVMYADAILLPVCASAFDRESAAECLAELQSLPRVASGRCKLAAVGMRIDGRTRGAQTLAAWAVSIGVPLLGVLRESQNYVRCVEEGLTVFDLPPSEVRTDLSQWAPVLRWVDEVAAGERIGSDGPVTVPSLLAATTIATPPTTTAFRSNTTTASNTAVGAPTVPWSLRSLSSDAVADVPARAARATVAPSDAARAVRPVVSRSPAPARIAAAHSLPAVTARRTGLGAELGRLLGALGVPRFLLRDRSA